MAPPGTDPPSTPLPVPVVRRLAVLFTAGAVALMIYDLPEVDSKGRDNALSGIKRRSRSAYDWFFSISSSDREAVRQAQDAKKSRPPPPSPPTGGA
jgi:hypothetical protein